MLVSRANNDLLHSYLPWGGYVVILRFFVYVQFFYVLLALYCAHLRALQYWFGYA